MRKVLTLCMVMQDGKLLLGMKKRGFGMGRWNGFGGKVEEGESIEKAAKREVFEELGLMAKSVEQRGLIRFDFEDGTRGVEVHIFACDDFDGEAEESEEMRPEWFDVDKIPIARMWTADASWLPLFLSGKTFKGDFTYDRPSSSDRTSVIIRKNLVVIDDEPGRSIHV
ncbi:MAG: 8-oxo-dGTP diphosphatase [Candidatus Moranbacteria bacterium]|nr:8-oxo-dGTP diphosphatase [Candidatus Moranbacteria bacterium]